MSKLKSDSKWNELTEEQRDTLEAWLFEENIAYREALERLEQQFGFQASLPGLARLYQRLAQQRLDAELAGLNKTTDKYEENHARMEKLGPAAMMLVANRLWQLAASKPGNVKDLASLARVLLENGALEVKRRWIELEELRYGHQAAMDEINADAAAKAKADMQAIMQQLMPGGALPGMNLVKTPPVPDGGP